MEKIVTTTYKGRCPRCGKEQIDSDPAKVDIDCWDCLVNANLERDDIKRDLETAIKSSTKISKIGLRQALEIVKKYDRT